MLVFLYLEKGCLGIMCVHQYNLLGLGALVINKL